MDDSDCRWPGWRPSRTLVGVTLFSPGRRLHDRYVLVDRIGAGGMSEVWRATDELLGRQVAVKALAARPGTGLSGLPGTTWREARAMARLSHPNVTQIHDYGEVGGPGGEVTAYLVMELVAGESLAARLQRGPLPYPEAVRVVRQVAAALVAAHRLGVVHRDIKPGNVMLTPDGVKVHDFGIAAVAGRSDTDPGRLAGTPTYAAPERLDPAAPPAAASDIYSLGVLLYEVLAGRPPEVHGSWADAAAAAAERAGADAPRPEVPGLPAAVADLCQACRAPDPARRPTAVEVVAALADAPSTAAVAGRYAVGAAVPRAAATRVEDAPPPVVPVRQPARPRRRLVLAGTGAALVALVLGVVLVAAALRPGDPGGDRPGTAAGAGTTPPASAAASPSSPPAPTEPTGSPAPAAVVSELDLAIGEEFAANAMTADAAEDLRDELDDLREATGRGNQDRPDGKVRKEAEDLQEEIDDLARDGDLDGLAAGRLSTLLIPLLR
jgi:serine/threonine-protein kinase